MVEFDSVKWCLWVQGRNRCMGTFRLARRVRRIGGGVVVADALVMLSHARLALRG